MSFVVTKRGVALACVLAFAGCLLVVAFARQALTGLAVNAVLNLAGASEVNFTITAASPWRVVIDDLSFQVNGQPVAARRISVTRQHWWTPSLGAVRVESARVAITAGPDGIKLPIPGPEPKPADTTNGPVKIPLEEFSLDGSVMIKLGPAPEQALAIALTARPQDATHWQATIRAEAPGLQMSGEGSLDLTTKDTRFQVPAVSIDVQAWQGFVQEILPLPDGVWEAEGKLTGSVAGQYVDDRFLATARVALQQGRVRSPDGKIAAEGITADIEFTDLGKVVSSPGTLRIRELQTGQMRFQDIDGELAFHSSDHLRISRVQLKTLGGTLSAEPFDYYLSRDELAAVVVADAIAIEQVMALTSELPAKASGRVSGRLPLRIDGDGLHFGTGWLQLTPGAYADIQLQAEGLLTGGASPSSPSYAVLKKVESGLLKLKVSALRLDIRPPNAPEGRSAQLHVAGEPVDPQVKAPVVLDLNVNGPLEKLLNLGLDSRVSFGSKP